MAKVENEKKTVKPAVKKVVAKETTKVAPKSVLSRPVISEKAFALQEADKYVFLVTPEANKDLVKKEVEKLFKVDVLAVNIIRIPGKLKRVGKIFGRRKDVKKAVVKIKQGQKIEEFKA